MVDGILKPKLVITRGPSGSGKTYWAKKWVKDGPLRDRIERDMLRKVIFNHDKRGLLTKEQEKVITAEQTRYIEERVRVGFSVVVSDTNISYKSVNRFKQLAQRLGMEFEVKEFHTPLEVCLERNAARPEKDRVPEKVVKRMHKQMHKNQPKWAERPFNVSADKVPAIIFDMDGTVRLMNGRSPYDSVAAAGDLPNVPVIILIKGMMVAYPDCTFIALSGADDVSYDIVEDQLIDWGIEPDMILMRAAKDNRKDSVVKAEIYRDEIEPEFNVIFVVDDRNQVVDMWRDLGLHCFQVAEGNF